MASRRLYHGDPDPRRLTPLGVGRVELVGGSVDSRPDLGPVPLALDGMIQSHEVDGARSAMIERAVDLNRMASAPAFTTPNTLRSGTTSVPQQRSEDHLVRTPISSTEGQ
jgi:hypothetical protein